jgi:C-terminal processing protease CtpA/Prc
MSASTRAVSLRITSFRTSIDRWTVIGKRTWGGLVGIGGYPELIDGGSITAPRAAIYGLNGDWEVENHGVTPDYDVELDPTTTSTTILGARIESAPQWVYLYKCGT